MYSVILPLRLLGVSERSNCEAKPLDASKKGELDGMVLGSRL